MSHQDENQSDMDALSARFADFSSATPLPFDHGRRRQGPVGPRVAVSHTSHRVLARGEREAFAAAGLHPARVVEAVWALVLSRMSGETDVVCGALGTSPQGVDWVCPLRFRLEPQRPLAECVREVDATYGALREAPRATGVPFESAVLVREELDNRQLALVADLPLALEVSLQPRLSLRLSADAERFDPDALNRLAAHLLIALSAFQEAPDLLVKDVPSMSPDDVELVTHGWNARAHQPGSIHLSVHERVSAQALRTPDAVAVRAADGSITYADLEARANALAARLVGHGVTADDRVAICRSRTGELVVSLLAILKAGGAYLPIEPGYPASRVAFMLGDARPKLVLTEAAFRDVFRDAAIPVIELGASRAPESAAHFRPVDVSPESLAYVLYTSGSTGTPKGVEIPHRAIDRLVCNVDYVRLGTHVTMLQTAPIAFDASTFEIWGPLVNGGCVALYPDAVPTSAGLKRAIAQHGVTTLWLTAALFNAVIDDDPRALAGLSQLLIGGEALSVSHVRRALQAMPTTEIINGYGPTECTTFAATYSIPRVLPDELGAIPIGRAIRQTRVYVLDAELRPLPVGALGELYIGGAGLARGYLSRPELTRERFLADPFMPGERIYRTGDMVRFRRDGMLDYVGRHDQQVKVRGFRIELGEVVSAIEALPSVQRALVLARKLGSGDKRLVAYCVAKPDTEAAEPQELRRALVSTLPDYMVPSAFMWLPALPLTLNGKVDLQALPEPTSARPVLDVEYVAPRSPTEQQLSSMWAGALDLERVGVLDNIFELGASSLMVVRTLAQLEREHALKLSPVNVFERPTVAGMASQLEHQRAGHASERVEAPRKRRRTIDGAVAIIGMAGRFPGARSVGELWSNLCGGVESIRFFELSELDASLRPADVHNPAYVRARGVLDEVDRFDAAFFGITPKEAMLMDPQQRLMLEVAWETLESAGYCPDTYRGDIGIFAGKYNNTYFSENVSTRPDLIAELGAFTTMIANEKDYIATRIAHRLGLRGPALSIHTACSTSLVAVVQAFQNLLLGQCDMALAGGVAITVPVCSGHVYQAGAMLSADGHTRSFDAGAQGTVFSDGAALVLLKRLDDALADGDAIYGVIRGAATNNDGSVKASFTAPSVEGQAAVIALAQEQAGVAPRDISYVEAHGTATPLGDPIEVEALTRAFRRGTTDSQFCALGSVKSNLGHLVTAAGAVGLIKTALCLTERTLVPSLMFEQENPKIGFASTPFFVNTERTPWSVPEGRKRIAGVSSFGVGGTNAHVIVEEPPERSSSAVERSAQLLMLSARSEGALTHASENLASFLERAPEACLADVAFTLHAGRRAFSHRRAVTAESALEAAAALRGSAPRRTTLARADGTSRRVAFMFPGQGTQYPRMGGSLYRESAVFRHHLDRAAETLQPLLGVDLRTLLYPGQHEASTTSELLSQTSFTQPALFAIEYAMAKLWQSFGIEPEAMIGHSVGEFVCAVLADVMSFEDALRLVALRGRLMQDMPAGSMLSVRLSAEQVARELPAGLAIAADNGPKLCVVAGTHDDIAHYRAQLEARGELCRLLQTSHAFHSPMMDPVVERFREAVRSIELAAPRVRFVSTATGDWITAAQARDPEYWAQHVRVPVLFTSAVRKLLEEPALVLLEVGPRATLATLARQQISDRTKQRCVSSTGETDEDAWHVLLGAAAQLWQAGVELDPRGVTGCEPRRRLALPTYPFERKRYWVEPQRAQQSFCASTAVSTAPAPLTLPPVTPQLSEVDMPSQRHQRVLLILAEILEEASGLEVSPDDAEVSFLELGLDSLFLTQFALAIGNRFKLKVTFRELLEQFTTMNAVAGHIEATIPDAEQSAPPAALAVMAAAPPSELAAPAASALPATPWLAGVSARPAVPAAPAGSLQSVVEQQLQIMAQQLALLSGAPMQASARAPEQPPAQASLAADVPAQAEMSPTAASSVSIVSAASPSSDVPPPPSHEVATDEEPPATMMKYDVKKAFGAIARISTSRSDELTPKQRAKLDAFVRRYNDKTKGSKRFAQDSRRVMADPRAVTGFRPAIKELVYPILVDRSAGSRLWDVDGNEYIDALNGFGLNLFGWQPEFVTKAIEEQLHRGHEVGPQHPLQADVARLICELTGFDRAAFCNTGSEAVMGCTRIARTVTGRSKIAIFTGGYHGIFDEVVVRGTKKLRSIPAAPGIMPATSENVLVLDYGTDETLEILRSRADELAAIIVEPVQSRRPDLQPREFIHALRDLTRRSGSVYVFDEVVTGFRTAPGGAQEFYGVKADLAAYGKVVGGGLPIGVIAGKTEYMDALDGGFWQFGDDSVPPIGVTYFAGTFVRHPLALAAAKAVLTHLKQQGPSLQRTLNARTTAFADDLNAFATSVGAPLKIKHFASLWKTFFDTDQAFGDLLFFMMRDRGVHIYDGFPCFFTTSHSDADFAFISSAFKESVLELQEAGFLPGRKQPVRETVLDLSTPPVAGARLGRDPSGSPAWYVPHPSDPKKYIKHETH